MIDEGPQAVQRIVGLLPSPVLPAREKYITGVTRPPRAKEK